MSKRKLLMKQKIDQAIRSGHPAEIVIPRGLKRKSLTRLFDPNVVIKKMRLQDFMKTKNL